MGRKFDGRAKGAGRMRQLGRVQVCFWITEEEAKACRIALKIHTLGPEARRLLLIAAGVRPHWWNGR